ncbi:MAG: hypothetical protein NW241_01340 [Bacteroidia bacterium]|nr:hypothetical protein [Bacteroidia bacterium]
MKNIYIFASPSSKPDLYINIIGYWVSTFGSKELGNVSLLRIQDSSQNSYKILDDLKYTRQCIEKQMYSLAREKYLSWNPKENYFDNLDNPKKIKISEEFKAIYEESFSLISQHEIRVNVLVKDKLGTQINDLFSYEHEENFDVTGVVNRYLVLISAYLLARKHSLYSLEVHKRFLHNEDDLIHNFQPNDYTYHHLEIPNEIKINFKNHENNKLSSKIIGEKFEKYKDLKINWLNQLAKDNTDSVIGKILDFAFESNNDILIKEAVHQSARWSRLNKQISKGIYPDDFEMMEQRKIISSLIELIQKMGDYLNDIH